MTVPEHERFTACNLPYYYYSLEYAFAALAGAGYRNVEFFAGTPHFFVDESGHSDCAAVRRLARDHGLSLPVLHPETLSLRSSLCAAPPEWRRRSLDCFRRALDAAAELGASLVALEAGGAFLDEPPGPSFDRCAENLSALAEYAEPLGLTLALASLPPDEPSPVHTAGELRSMLDTVGSPRLKALLSVPSAISAGESISSWFETVGADIVYVHLTDGSAQGREASTLRQRLGELEQAGYGGLLGQFFTDDACLERPAEGDLGHMLALGQALL